MNTGTFSLVIPAYNEAHRLPTSLGTIVRFLPRFARHSEIIVVDDGSTDATAAIVARFQNRHANIRLMRRPHRGKGAAVATGMVTARGDVIGFTDADLATPLRFFKPLVETLSHGADVVIGSRAIVGARSFSEQSAIRQFLGYMFGYYAHRLLLSNVKDTQCGIKVFRKSVVKPLFRNIISSGVLFDLEVLIRTAKAGYTVAEIPVEWNHHPETRLSYTPFSALLLFIDVWRLRQRYGIVSPLRVCKLR